MIRNTLPENQDVARQRRKSRSRKLVLGFFLFLGVVVLLESPLTRVRTLEVTGNLSIPEKRILSESGLYAGMNIWQVNASAVQSRIVTHEPLVQSVDVNAMYFKRTVRLVIHEKHVVAIYESNGKLYDLLNDGKIYKVADARDGLSWVLITSTFGSVNSGQAPNEFVAELCSQLSDVSSINTIGISEIHIDESGVATLYLNNGFEAQCLVNQFRGVLPNLTQSISYFTSHGYAPGLIDMTGVQPYRYTPFVQASGKGSKP